MAKRLTKIEASILKDHPNLDDQDECYFSGEYSAKKGYKYSFTNNLVVNFKKSIENRGTKQWQHKDQAILKAAQLLGPALKPNPNVTFIPVPPSKSKSDPLYDDRMLRLLKEIFKEHATIDIRELVLQRESTEASHETEFRPSPQDLFENYFINKKFISPAPRKIVVVDDVITTGGHFKAMKKILLKEFPDAKVLGVFIARRVPDSNYF